MKLNRLCAGDNPKIDKAVTLLDVDFAVMEIRAAQVLWRSRAELPAEHIVTPLKLVVDNG